MVPRTRPDALSVGQRNVDACETVSSATGRDRHFGEDNPYLAEQSSDPKPADREIAPTVLSYAANAMQYESTNI